MKHHVLSAALILAAIALYSVRHHCDGIIGHRAAAHHRGRTLRGSLLEAPSSPPARGRETVRKIDEQMTADSAAT
jgi:hypothetical protein